jgi:hypothetical protein
LISFKRNLADPTLAEVGAMLGDGKHQKTFRVKHPALLKIDGKNGVRHITGNIEGAGEMGILFVGDSEVPDGADVELTITLPHQQVSSPGKIVAVERRSPGEKVLVAIKCQGPLLESSLLNASRRRSSERPRSA